ncbi:hypothetical protein RRG08_057946 [Elysia crispata]|uniref:Uncharacterized protein n=1 Tax=Elysia crispata TaxID=231223 RepID=A0AAE1CX36_9GAST|nr:hypothetical protein RRG08_057946 [Elysia crispata]
MIMVNVLGVCLLLLAAASHGQSTSHCSVGWFGPNCQYQCHCAGSAPCDKVDGSCSSGCHLGWFGPACQYEFIGFTVLGNSALDWLTDQNDTTCNTDQETPVYFKLKTPIPLKWIRIVVSRPALLRNIRVYYYIENKNASIKCSGPKVNISSTVQDIHCPTVDDVAKMTVLINGEAGRGLCSIYLSAGNDLGDDNAVSGSEIFVPSDKMRKKKSARVKGEPYNVKYVGNSLFKDFNKVSNLTTVRPGTKA